MSTNHMEMEASQVAEMIGAECVGARVRMLSRAVSRIYDDMLRPYGVRFSQMNILTVVTRRGPIQPVDVARLLSIEKSTLSRNVRLMEVKGWIERLPAESGNAHLLRVTDAGRELLTEASSGWHEAQRRVTSLLGKRTADAMRSAANCLHELEPGQ